MILLSITGVLRLIIILACIYFLYQITMRFILPLLMRSYFNKIQRDMHKQFYGKIHQPNSIHIQKEEEFTDYEEVK
ncbi:MAG: hypothetical protein KatS3mg035_0426 [Bacteroidia bacterium]|nr:MAG: hypothetical protein KatS3mg035_0426 [Bacteroidia bacterium]